MGLYINPLEGEKEDWLRQHATLVDPGIFGDSLKEQYAGLCYEGELPICLIDNGPFTAAGVAFSLNEYKAFVQGVGRRPYRWFTAPISELRKLPGLSSLKEPRV
jgi:hypothetical protein